MFHLHFCDSLFLFEGLPISLGSFLSVETEVLVHIQQFAYICQLPLEISSRKSRDLLLLGTDKVGGDVVEGCFFHGECWDDSWSNASQHSNSVTCDLFSISFWFLIVLDLECSSKIFRLPKSLYSYVVVHWLLSRVV